MPPSPRFTREQMIEAALEVVREKGADALTAREVGRRLGCSAMPVFTAFGDMAELRAEVHRAASRLFNEFIATSRDFTPAFKQMGMQAILFARREPNLFRLLNLSEFVTGGSMEEVWARMDLPVDAICEGLVRAYDLPVAEARELFRHVWTYTYGIAGMCATRVCDFTDEQLAIMLGLDFNAMLQFIKAGGLAWEYPPPQTIQPAEPATL